MGYDIPADHHSSGGTNIHAPLRTPRNAAMSEACTPMYNMPLEDIFEVIEEVLQSRSLTGDLFSAADGEATMEACAAVMLRLIQSRPKKSRT